MSRAAPRSLTLTLTFHEQTRDYGAVPFSSDVVLHQGDLAAGQTLAFELALPVEAPPSVKAEYSELFWQLDVRSDERGLDTSTGRRLEVRPH